MSRARAWYLAALTIGCTPQERQVARDDGAQIAADVARCIAQNATQPNATAETVALSCGLSEIPDALRLLVDEVRAARGQSTPDEDGGAP